MDSLVSAVVPQPRRWLQTPWLKTSLNFFLLQDLSLVLNYIFHLCFVVDRRVLAAIPFMIPIGIDMAASMVNIYVAFGEKRFQLVLLFGMHGGVVL